MLCITNSNKKETHIMTVVRPVKKNPTKVRPRKRKGKPKKKAVNKRLPPKRSIILAPRSTWISFLGSVRAEKREEYKDLTFGELCQALSPIWRKMTEEEKKPHQLNYEKDRDRYHSDLSKLTDKDKKVLRAHRRIRRLLRKGRPKTANSTFMLFVSDERPKVVQDFPGITFKEIGRELGFRWKKLDDTLRAPYLEKAKLDRIRFNAELAKWKIDEAAKKTNNKGRGAGTSEVVAVV
jgi:hypothetical protein